VADKGPWVETATCHRCGRVYSSSSDVSRAAAQGGATNQANTCAGNDRRAAELEATRAETRRKEAERQEQLRQQRENRRKK
jgi:hypothetical protein